MITNEQYKKLIEEVVQESKLYLKNERLFDKFCYEIYLKTHLVLGSGKNKKELREYIKENADKIMLEVLDDEQGVVGTNIEEDVISIKTLISDETAKSDIANSITEEEAKKIYSLIPDPKPYERNTKKASRNLIDIVANIQKLYPQYPYYLMFYLRYYELEEQKEIAKKLNITQAELSRLFAELSQVITRH